MRPVALFLLLVSIGFFSGFQPSGIGSTPSCLEGSVETHVYSTPDGVPLSLDLRIPSHPRWDLPGIVFVHGGGFMTGTRDSAPVVGFLEAMSDAGIVSASISYRLTQKGRGFGCDVPVEEKRRAVRIASEDLMEARHWLERNGSKLPERWVAVGSSAGAETALWTGYAASPAMWAGIISFSGALEASLPLPDSSPPLLAFHGACDKVVPAGHAIHRGCDTSDVGAWDLCGGPCLVERLQERNKLGRLWMDCLGGHEVCNHAMLRSDVHAIVADWLQNPEFTHSALDMAQDDTHRPYTESYCAQPCNEID